MSPSTGSELQEEVNVCLRRLEHLSKPPPVMVTNLTSTSYTVLWERCEPESGLEVIYRLHFHSKIFSFYVIRNHFF